MEGIGSVKIGDCMGVSSWLKMNQKDIIAFGVNTRDVEPLHTEPDWCLQHSPYKVPISYGFHTLSLLSWFMHDATEAMFAGHEGTVDFPLNYGFNRLRFVTPVRVNSSIRAKFILKKLEERHPGELLITTSFEVEIQGHDRPAIVGEWLLLWVTGNGREQVGRALANEPKAE